MRANLATVGHANKVIRFDPQRYHLRQTGFHYNIKDAKRIKDWQALERAVDQKIGEQIQFVAWWDANVRGRGQPKTNSPGSRLILCTVAEKLTGMTQQRVSDLRWLLKEPEKYRQHLLGAAYRTAMLEAKPNCRAGTGEDEWYTPAQYIELVRLVLGEIDLDPASCQVAQRTVRAKTFFPKDDDGLENDWHGRVYCNAAFCQPEITLLVDTLLREIAATHVTAAILLTNNDTNTAWFQKAAAAAAAICFPSSRKKFSRDGIQFTHAPAQGQAFFYFGQDRSAFARMFGSIGVIVTIRSRPRGN